MPGLAELFLHLKTSGGPIDGVQIPVFDRTGSVHLSCWILFVNMTSLAHIPCRILFFDMQAFQ